MHKVEVDVGGKTLSIETGRMAKQSDGSVFMQYEGSAVLVTAVANKKPNSRGSFLPLTVNYIEKTYAAGKIPGGFFKREARPTDRETLISRLIDRPTRPLFPEGYFHETQICCTVVSADVINDPDVVAITGASAALLLSGIPVTDAFAGVRVAMIDDEYIINPTYEQMEKSLINIVVAGTSKAVTMVEGCASEVPEDKILAGINCAHDAIKKIIPVLTDFASKHAKPAMKWSAPEVDEDAAAWADGYSSKIAEAIKIKAKQERSEAIDVIAAEAESAYISEKGVEELSETASKSMSHALHEIEKNLMRRNILDTGVRADGRTSTEIRPITCEVDILARAHGSSLFTRGETQALVVATLGTKSDAQRIDNLEGESTKTFMLHYNFPPYSVGEVAFLRGPGRREIGHGNLAERALIPVLPDEKDFPYTIRLVSEILESNGSSSMASVCGGTLALMDAGVPIKKQVAGIAMGLIKEGDDVAILSDILGLEDHLGDMDFKVTGTESGITAIQMDIKINGVTKEIMETALEQALQGRTHILGKMASSMSTHRESVSSFAPRIITTQVPIDKIKDVIGPGGKNIRGIIEKTGVKIDINDEGIVNIASVDRDSAQAALQMVEDVIREPELDAIYDGVIRKILDFGALVEIFPGSTGLLHISQISDRRIDRVEDVLNLGETVTVKCIGIDRGGKIRLTRKDVPQS